MAETWTDKSKLLGFAIVSTAYFLVALPSKENQMESLPFTVKLYLPIESVTVPLPEVLNTETASIGFLAVIS